MNEKPLILVVDDQPWNIALLKALLSPQGYEIVTAASGAEALDKLSGNQIDLILLDVMMPGMDGFEVTRRIRQDDTRRLLPIILVTALQETEDRIKGIDAGCDDFISKPVDKMELSARVKSLLRLKAYNDLMSSYREELEEKHRQLQQAFDEIRTLRGIVPICSYCKKIRDDEGYWNQVEKYVSDHTEAKFSHGICPACLEREMKELKA